MELTSRQIRFFDDFGFLFLPGLMREEAPWIIDEFVGNLDTRARWSIGMDEVPCVAPDNHPGDVIVFNLHTLHNALGGGNRRRMLNLLACSSCRTEAERAFLRSRLPASRDDLRWDILRETAAPERMRHLEQPWHVLS